MLFNENHVAMASFLGTPLAGAALLAFNAQQCGHRGQAVFVLLCGFSFSIAVLVLAAAVGELIPGHFGVLIGAGYAFAMKSITTNMFGSELEKSTPPRLAGLRVIGVTVCSIVTLISLMYIGAISLSVV
ncbi:hypothetical protein [Rhodopirellula sallentina]|uniref:Membrane protein n=1 Tax=Rhodopirellula sallentina SM41 TaxID=1263870 RepID=M5UDF1_9BACT|nr:hypothetical protein [Rhodopirellula sallentina]EMI55881.1 membrane protein [Rhodopirellula sallentina SM41]